MYTTNTGVTSVVIVGFIMNYMNLSSIAVIWAILNQVRSLALLMLTGSYVPKDIEDYLKGVKVFNFGYSSITLTDLPGIKKGVDWLDYEQDDEVMKALGYDSGSSLLNNFKFVLMFSFVIMAHVL